MGQRHEFGYTDPRLMFASLSSNATTTSSTFGIPHATTGMSAYDIYAQQMQQQAHHTKHQQAGTGNVGVTSYQSTIAQLEQRVQSLEHRILELCAWVEAYKSQRYIDPSGLQTTATPAQGNGIRETEKNPNHLNGLYTPHQF